MKYILSMDSVVISLYNNNGFGWIILLHRDLTQLVESRYGFLAMSSHIDNKNLYDNTMIFHLQHRSTFSTKENVLNSISFYFENYRIVDFIRKYQSNFGNYELIHDSVENVLRNF
jgi:hypothetical protein